MKILVCVKRVPDTSARVKVAGDGMSVDLAGVEHVVSPYDEFAMEDALVQKETHGAEVVAVTIGDDSSEDQLRTCLALGADRAILVNDPASAGSDTLGIARVLAAVVAKESPDVVYLGKQGTDGDFHAVGAQLATLANLPFISAAYPSTISGTTVTCERPVEGGTEVVESATPVVISAEKSKGKEPRYANLKGIMMAKKKPIERLTIADLGVDPSTVGSDARKVKITGVTPPPVRSGGTILKDLPTDEAVDKLLTLLREEAKVL